MLARYMLSVFDIETTLSLFEIDFSEIYLQNYSTFLINLVRNSELSLFSAFPTVHRRSQVYHTQRALT